MRVRIIYRRDCPCVEATQANLEAALALLGTASTHVELVPLDTEQEAHRESLHGSPTVLIDGRDPFARDDATTTLACRPDGAPTLRQLLEALS